MKALNCHHRIIGWGSSDGSNLSLPVAAHNSVVPMLRRSHHEDSQPDSESMHISAVMGVQHALKVNFHWTSVPTLRKPEILKF